MSTSTPTRRYHTVNEAAQILGVTPQRVRQLISSGQLAADKVHARLILISESTLRRFQKINRPDGVHLHKRSRS